MMVKRRKGGVLQMMRRDEDEESKKTKNDEFDKRYVCFNGAPGGYSAMSWTFSSLIIITNTTTYSLLPPSALACIVSAISYSHCLSPTRTRAPHFPSGILVLIPFTKLVHAVNKLQEVLLIRRASNSIS